MLKVVQIQTLIKKKKKKGEVLGKGAKRKKYSQGFRDTWLEDKFFRDWLIKREDGGKTVPYCKVCRSKLSCAKTALVRHAETNAHQREIKRSMNLEKTQPKISSFMGSSQSKVAKIEIKLCTFLAENNLPMSLSEDLVALLKGLFPADETLKKSLTRKTKSNKHTVTGLRVSCYQRWNS